MKAIDNSSLPHAQLPGLDHVTLAGADVGLRKLSVWQQTIAPGGATPPHFHDCEEVVLVTAGSGAIYVPDGSYSFGAGTTLLIPPLEEHQIVNTGSAPMELVGIFSATPVGVFAPGGESLDLPWRS
jgi:mannose-6-phosphate isomerase-like protein (cupin superfamily)